MGLRYPAAFVVAFAVTFGLFWVMQALIGVEGALDKDASRRVVDSPAGASSTSCGSSASRIQS
jgi:hypothetical protein